MDILYCPLSLKIGKQHLIVQSGFSFICDDENCKFCEDNESLQLLLSSGIEDVNINRNLDESSDNADIDKLICPYCSKTGSKKAIVKMGNYYVCEDTSCMFVSNDLPPDIMQSEIQVSMLPSTETNLINKVTSDHNNDFISHQDLSLKYEFIDSSKIPDNALEDLINDINMAKCLDNKIIDETICPYCLSNGFSKEVIKIGNYYMCEDASCMFVANDPMSDTKSSKVTKTFTKDLNNREVIEEFPTSNKMLNNNAKDIKNDSELNYKKSIHKIICPYCSIVGFSKEIIKKGNYFMCEDPSCMYLVTDISHHTMQSEIRINNTTINEKNLSSKKELNYDQNECLIKNNSLEYDTEFNAYNFVSKLNNIIHKIPNGSVINTSIYEQLILLIRGYISQLKSSEMLNCHYEVSTECSKCTCKSTNVQNNDYFIELDGDLALFNTSTDINYTTKCLICKSPLNKSFVFKAVPRFVIFQCSKGFSTYSSFNDITMYNNGGSLGLLGVVECKDRSDQSDCPDEILPVTTSTNQLSQVEFSSEFIVHIRDSVGWFSSSCDQNLLSQRQHSVEINNIANVRLLIFGPATGPAESQQKILESPISSTEFNDPENTSSFENNRKRKNEIIEQSNINKKARKQISEKRNISKSLGKKKISKETTVNLSGEKTGRRLPRLNVDIDDDGGDNSEMSVSRGASVSVRGNVLTSEYNVSDDKCSRDKTVLSSGVSSGYVSHEVSRNEDTRSEYMEPPVPSASINSGGTDRVSVHCRNVAPQYRGRASTTASAASSTTASSCRTGKSIADILSEDNMVRGRQRRPLPSCNHDNGGVDIDRLVDFYAQILGKTPH